MADRPLELPTSIFWSRAIQLRGFRKRTSFCSTFCARSSRLGSVKPKTVEAGMPPAIPDTQQPHGCRYRIIPRSLAAARARDSIAGARSPLNFQSRILRFYRELDRSTYKHHRTPQDVSVAFLVQPDTSALEQSAFSGHPTRQAPALRRSIL